LLAVDATNALQANEQLLDGVEIDIIAREARDMVGKPIRGRHLIDDLIAHGEVLNNPRGGGLTPSGHGFSSTTIYQRNPKKSIKSSATILKNQAVIQGFAGT